MRYANLLIRTQKELPAQEESKNAELLLRGSFIHKEMAGVYSYLPLGLRTLNKIAQIVREEMNVAGAVELLMPALSPKENWLQTDRWDAVDVLYKLDIAGGGQCALNPTHEEVVTPLVQNFAQSPKDFPVCVYQIQNKFRNEPRAKSGILRGREFLMKDAYSFHTSQESFEAYYDVMTKAYHRIYERLGIGDITLFVAASGGDFSKHSHEFQTLSPVGEDEIYIHAASGRAWNKEIKEEIPSEILDEIEVKSAIEVGNIFPLSDRFSKAFKFKAQTPDGEKSILMGCYGIGISRLMGTLVEIFNDERGIIWPHSIAPFQIYIAPIGKDEAAYAKAQELEQKLESAGYEVLLDDRETAGPGQKFADSELLGIPLRIVISPKTLEQGSFEVTTRHDNETQIIAAESLEAFLSKTFT